MEDPFRSSFSSSSLLDQYASSGCTLAEMLEYSDESLGFMELLNTRDFGSPDFDGAGLIDSSIRPIQNPEVLNAPATPNYSSVSAESSDGHKDELLKEEEDDEEVEKKKTKKQKTSQKKQREPRFAFMTKSEVDHLEDGYRWRKYGQKAVKNSPFPRSYYKCTSPSCSVKKRVERSFTDRAIVVTTYEGKHTHPSPQALRAAPTYAGFSASTPPPHNQNSINYSVLMSGYWGSGGGRQQLSFSSMADNGLLQDIVAWPKTEE